MVILRFVFSYGVDTMLWPSDMTSPLGFPCETRLLPFSEQTRADIDRLAEWYQSSLGWDDPGGPSPWTTQESESFDAQAKALLGRIRSKLPPGWALLGHVSEPCRVARAAPG
ncbi:hypothetical protein ABH926_009188 [Catenulispora sp. GP43]